MSLETWKTEFYPIDASDPTATSSELSAAKHSLGKWKGLTEANLIKHGVKLDGWFVKEYNKDERFKVDAESCSLCQRHFYGIALSCNDCSLFKLRNDRCDRGIAAPWKPFVCNSDPYPMIYALKETVRRLEQEEKGKGV